MHEKPNIVIDTNVLLTALKSSRGNSFRLLSLVGQGLFTTHISVPLVAEYEAVLKRGHLTLSDIQIDAIIDFLCAKSFHHKIFYLWRPILQDANDDFLLELAVSAQSKIVTWNERDFKKAELFGIPVMNPRTFLATLGRL